MHNKFTLIELLVVIAIIGILTSLLMPELSKVRQKGFQTVCLNNCRQATLAVIMYADENNMYAPSDEPNVNNSRWFNKLQPGYLPGGSDGAPASTALNCPIAKDLTESWQSHISLNSYMSGKDQTGNYVTAVSLNATSAETCVVIDSYDNWRSNKSNHMTVSKLLTASEDVRIAKHNLKANVSFYDGSAKPIPANTLLQYNYQTHIFWDPAQ